MAGLAFRLSANMSIFCSIGYEEGYVHEVSREEVSVQADTYRRVFHSEVSYGQPLVALRFSDGGQVYKCSIVDQDRARMERLEPDYRDYGFLERLK